MAYLLLLFALLFVPAASAQEHPTGPRASACPQLALRACLPQMRAAVLVGALPTAFAADASRREEEALDPRDLAPLAYLAGVPVAVLLRTTAGEGSGRFRRVVLPVAAGHLFGAMSSVLAVRLSARERGHFGATLGAATLAPVAAAGAAWGVLWATGRLDTALGGGTILQEIREILAWSVGLGAVVAVPFVAWASADYVNRTTAP